MKVYRFYIDSDVFLFCSVFQKLEFLIKAPECYTTWLNKSLDYLGLFTACSNIRYKRLVEYTLVHREFPKYRFPKVNHISYRNMLGSGSVDFIFVKFFNYSEYLRQVRSNRGYLVSTNVCVWALNWISHDWWYEDSSYQGMFLGNYLVINNNTLDLFKPLVNSFEQILYDYFIHDVYNNIFMVGAFWTFMRSDILLFSFLFSAIRTRKQHNVRFDSIRHIFFHYHKKYKITINCMKIYIKSYFLIKLLKKTRHYYRWYVPKSRVSLLPKRDNWFSYHYVFNRLFYSEKYIESSYFCNIYDLTILFNYSFDYTRNNLLLNNHFFFDYYKNNFYINNEILYKRQLWFGIFYSIGSDRGNVYYEQALVMRFDSYLLKFYHKYTNYFSATLSYEQLVYFIGKDLFYYYIDVWTRRSNYELWLYYAFFDGVDFHEVWGWYGRYRWRKFNPNRRHYLIQSPEYRPSYFILRILVEILVD